MFSRCVLSVQVVLCAFLVCLGVLEFSAGSDPAGADPPPSSVVTVRARGRLGTEGMELRINGSLAASWSGLSTSMTDYSHTVAVPTTVESIRVQAAGGGGWPKALVVDRVVIDGVVFESEASTTRSKGSWDSATGCSEGYKLFEWLHCGGGWFDYEAAAGVQLAGGTPPPPAGSSVVSVRARGRLGTEGMELWINGSLAASWSGLSTSMTDYSHTVAVPTTVESIRVQAAGGGWPKALVVDRVVIDGVVFESEASTTRSKGSWDSATGCSEGYKLFEWLHCGGGWFDYEAAAGVQLAGGTPPPPAGTPLVIFDTDVGVDIDDALALAMLHAYSKHGDAEISAVTISRNSDTAAKYVDAVNTFYGRPDIPIGVYRGTTGHDGTDRYTRSVTDSGLYPYDVDLTPIAEGYKTMRRVLADAPDGGVVIVQVGFSTNTAKLLRSGPDEISPLTGQQLVEDKVSMLAVMGGDNTGSRREFNVVQDLPSARIVFSEWQGPLLQNEARLGDAILYPGASVFSDFEYVEHHPIKDSYLNEKLPWHEDAGATYNMRSWDLLSVLSAIETPEVYFPVSGPGLVTIDPDGYTSFVESGGLHRTLGIADDLTAAERATIVTRLRELVTESP